MLRNTIHCLILKALITIFYHFRNNNKTFILKIEYYCWQYVFVLTSFQVSFFILNEIVPLPYLMKSLKINYNLYYSLCGYSIKRTDVFLPMKSVDLYQKLALTPQSLLIHRAFLWHIACYMLSYGGNLLRALAHLPLVAPLALTNLGICKGKRCGNPEY